MKFRTGLVVGLAVGYYYGTKAGRERYEQIDRYLDRVRSTDAYQQMSGRARDAVDRGKAIAKDRIKETAFGPEVPTTGNGANQPADDA